MTETPGSDQNQLATLVNGSGLPEKLRTKATRLLLRLIAGTVGARIYQEAQEGIDTIKGRSLVNMALAEEVARQAKADPQVMEIARLRYLGEEYRKQENLHKIAVAMQEELSQEGEPAAEPETEVEDDWLNVFSRFAGDASSERMQKLWGRVLAGEFRAPGSFSLQTLRFVSELDQPLAETFRRVARLAVLDFVVKDESFKRGQPFRDVLDLEEAGLLSGTHGFINKHFPANGYDQALAAGKRLALGGCGPAGTKAEVPALLFSKVGRELLRLVDEADDRANLLKLANYLRRAGFQTLWLGPAIWLGNGFGAPKHELI